MNIIARAALYIYDGSSMAPIFPEKVSKPCDEAAAYLSAVADKNHGFRRKPNDLR